MAGCTILYSISSISNQQSAISNQQSAISISINIRLGQATGTLLSVIIYHLQNVSPAIVLPIRPAFDSE
jgi:hypothetical protein